LSVGVGHGVIALAAEANVDPLAGISPAPEAQRVASLQDAAVRKKMRKTHLGPTDSRPDR
jgi:hypothetical protein